MGWTYGKNLIPLDRQADYPQRWGQSFPSETLFPSNHNCAWDWAQLSTMRSGVSRICSLGKVRLAKTVLEQSRRISALPTWIDGDGPGTSFPTTQRSQKLPRHAWNATSAH